MKHDAEEAPIVRRIFELAADSGFGQTRITKELNSDSTIPEGCKPFQEASVGYMLDNQIYLGTLRWGRKVSDIIDDTVIRHAKPEDEVQVFENFCEPIIPQELWDRVHNLRRPRSEEAKRRQALGKTPDGKLLTTPVRGTVLKYPLTGLVICGECSRAMTPTSSSVYERLDGKKNRYTAYACPGFKTGLCKNAQKIPE